MTITATRNPAALAWANFTPQAVVIDPIDGTAVDDVTSFNFNLPDVPPRNVGGQLALADPLTLTITPQAVVRIGVAQTPGLLAHEQLHYDVGFVIARVVAKELARLRAPTRAALAAQMRDIVQLHFHTRARLIQRRYDLDTRHGTNGHFQRIWAQNMATCLGNPAATHLLGWWL
jgi:hypothetical protein